MSNTPTPPQQLSNALLTAPSFPRGDEVFRVALENADPIVREAYMSLRFQNEQLSKALLTTNQQVQHDITWRNYVIERAEAQTARLIEQLVTCKTGKAEVKRALRLTREAANARINELEAELGAIVQRIHHGYDIGAINVITFNKLLNGA